MNLQDVDFLGYLDQFHQGQSIPEIVKRVLTEVCACYAEGKSVYQISKESYAWGIPAHLTPDDVTAIIERNKIWEEGGFPEPLPPNFNVQEGYDYHPTEAEEKANQRAWADRDVKKESEIWQRWLDEEGKIPHTPSLE